MRLDRPRWPESIRRLYEAARASDGHRPTAVYDHDALDVDASAAASPKEERVAANDFNAVMCKHPRTLSVGATTQLVAPGQLRFGAPHDAALVPMYPPIVDYAASTADRAAVRLGPHEACHVQLSAGDGEWRDAHIRLPGGGPADEAVAIRLRPAERAALCVLRCRPAVLTAEGVLSFDDNAHLEWSTPSAAFVPSDF